MANHQSPITNHPLPNKMFLTYLNRPEYFLQPIQVYRRLRRPTSQRVTAVKSIDLPWGLPLQIHPNPDDKVEWSLWVMGIYDLALSESLWRLTDRGETVLDIGANIGYMTSLLAHRVGQTGKVLAFEPCPEIYAELRHNITQWHKVQPELQIEVKTVALSNHKGTGLLRVPMYNHGEAALVNSTEEKQAETLKIHEVEIATLDDLWDNRIDVLKIDIEGHELAAFEGAKDLLEQHKIRDIFFEAHQGYSEAIIQFLEQYHYTVFRLWKGFWKPLLYPADYPEIHPWEPPNYIATLNPERVKARLKKRGWQVLKRG